MPPRIFAAGVALSVGVSVANAMPPIIQAIFYLVGLAAVVRRTDPLPVAEMLLITLAAGYLIVVRLLQGVDLEGSARVLRPCFEGFLLAHVLYRWCHLRSLGDLGGALTGMILIQAAVAMFMALFPTSRLEIIQEIYSDESYQGSQLAGALLFRGFGMTRHHLYGFSLAIGLAAAVLLLASRLDSPGTRSRLFSTAAVVGILLATLNARIGLMPIMLTYLLGITIFLHMYFVKHLVGFTLLFVLPIIYFGGLYFGDDFQLLLDWVREGFVQFIEPDAAGGTTLSGLQAMIVLSANPMEVLFGTGLTCDASEPCYSDIGFIRAIQEGGLIFLFLVMYLYWRLNQRIVRWLRHCLQLKRPHRWNESDIFRTSIFLALVLNGSFIAAMIKGEAFSPNDYSRLVATLAFLCLLIVGRSTSDSAVTGQVAQGLLPLGGSVAPTAAKFVAP